MRVENSFIPVRGVGERTERELWEHGITHWDEFDGSVVGPTRAERIEAFIERARPHARRCDGRFFADVLPGDEHWRLYENVGSETCFLDIETTGLSPDRAVVTTVSVHRDGETRTLVRGEDLSRGSLRRELDAAELLVTFNGRRFDVPFLEAEFGVDVSLPHADLMGLCHQLGYSGGLKRIEREFGLERDEPDVDGKEAVRLWKRYERGDEDALETLVRYNKDDARNMEPLMETVCDRLHRDVFEACCPD